MTDQVVVVGASGFGRETLDTLRAMIYAGADLQILGVIDDALSPENLRRLVSLEVPYLGTLDDWLKKATTEKYLLAIGNPKIRTKLVSKMDAADLQPFTAVHPTAVVGSDTRLGKGTIVCAAAVISTNVRLGSHVHINPHATIGHDSNLADFVSVNPAAVISGNVTIHTGSLLGASSTVLQGLAIGRDCIIGAGSVITRDVPPNSLAKGVPGRW